MPILVAMCWKRPGLRDLRWVGEEGEMFWKKESMASMSCRLTSASSSCILASLELVRPCSFKAFVSGKSLLWPLTNPRKVYAGFEGRRSQWDIGMVTIIRVEPVGIAASTCTSTLASSADSEAGMASSMLSQFAELGVMSSLTRNERVTRRDVVELTEDVSSIAPSTLRTLDKTWPSTAEEKLEPRDLGS